MEKEKLVQFIQQIMPMSLEKAEQITQYFTPKQFSKNDYLLKEGKICTKSYFIGIEGHEVTTEFYSKNHFCERFPFLFQTYSFKRKLSSPHRLQNMGNRLR